MPCGRAREARRAERPGRALPHRRSAAHRRERRACRRAARRRRAASRSGSTTVSSLRLRRARYATGSTSGMLNGVTIVDPESTWISADVELEPDIVVHPFTVLRGRTTVASGTEIGPHVVAIDARIGERVSIGPFCYLRPGTVLEPDVKAGTFVEIKNSRIGARTKVPHLVPGRCRRRRGHERRGREHHGELSARGGPAQGPDDDRQERQDKGPRMRSWLRDRGGRRMDCCRIGDNPRCPARSARGGARPAGEQGGLCPSRARRLSSLFRGSR